MSFYTSLSGLKAAQTDLGAISNNLANVGSTGFKKSRAQFGDLFASSPTQSTKMIAGQGVRLNGVVQQFTQGTLESSDKTLDLAIAGEGFFVTKGAAPRDKCCQDSGMLRPITIRTNQQFEGRDTILARDA